MALNSEIDKDGQVNKTKNDNQYKNLNPPVRGGENGSRSSTSEGIKESKPGKLFAGE